MSTAVRSASDRILKNSFWYGLETLLETFLFLGTSIAVARYLGPAKLGYFSYVNFFIMVVTRTSGSGLSVVTRKYMSEYLGLDQPGIARAVYTFAFRYQMLAAALIAGIGVVGVVLLGDPAFRTMSLILMLSLIPSMATGVASQANLAFEDSRSNTLSALGYMLSYTAVIVLTLCFRWDLVGIASATLIGRTVEVLLRLPPVAARLRCLPMEKLPVELARRVRRFCLEAIGIQLLMSVVWDRSEMIFLRAFCSLEQIAFYSVSFGLVNNLLVVPRVFGGAAGITLMVEASRDERRIAAIVTNVCRYLLFIVLPVHLGAAAITRNAINYTYGPRYMGAVPVLVLAALLSVPRAFQEIPDILIRAADQQKRLLLWLAVTGVINITLDAVLICFYGAVGAAIANGLAQTIGIFAIWRQARKLYSFRFPVAAAVKFATASLLMGVVAVALQRLLGGWPGMVFAVLLSIPLYLALVRTVHGFDISDRERLLQLGQRLPLFARRAFEFAAFAITPGQPIGVPREPA